VGWVTVSEASRQSGIAAATIRSALRHQLLEGREELGYGWIVPDATLEQLLLLREERHGRREAPREPEDAEADEADAELWPTDA
jgi:hypothetical protein